jgi:hypothetical protein
MGMILNTHRFASGDADATAFLSAAGITDATITDAINTLVTALKGYGLWTKMICLYPFVGGSEGTHKYNLKDPRDEDGAYRMTFPNGATHSANGVDWNGSNQYGDTKLNPTSFGYSDLNMHAAVYCREDINGGGGTWDAGSAYRFWIRLSNTAYYDTYTRVSVANTTSLGFFIANTTSSSVSQIIHNGVSLTTGSASVGTIGNNLFIGRGFGGWDTRQLSFFSYGSGLSQTQYENYNTAVQAFQTTLGRNV